MKRHLLLLALTALSFFVSAQNISVASFRLAEFDLTANTHGTQVLDQNGNTCALIKVETTQTGFAFDVGMMGIMKTEQHIGEIWVYVPYGVKHMTIQHQQLGTLRDYYFPCPIQEARTYIMQLATGTVSTIIENDMGGSYLMMTVEPKTATVYIDEQLKPVENGEVRLLLPYGRHTYRVEAPSYMNEAGAVEIGKERVELNISLTSTRATLTVDCADAEADIYINEEKKSRGSWTGQIVDGMYVVEARKAGHRSEKQSLTIAKQEQKTVTLNAPQPIYGKLNLDSSPGNCDVYLDGKLIGKSPDVFSNILVGSHTLELRKNGYDSKSQPISIEEGRITDMEMTLQRSGSVAQQPQPQQNGTPAVQTDKWKTFIMARTNVEHIDRPLIGCTVGRVKKAGWYLSCLSTFNHDKTYSYDSTAWVNKYKHLDLTAGAIFRCKNAFYWYVGAGWAKRIYTGENRSGVNIETGAMFHFKHFSIMTGAYGIIGSDCGFQLGLGYNF